MSDRIPESEEELNQKFYSYSSNLWKNVESYMGTIREEDLRVCGPEVCWRSPF